MQVEPKQVMWLLWSYGVYRYRSCSSIFILNQLLNILLCKQDDGITVTCLPSMATSQTVSETLKNLGPDPKSVPVPLLNHQVSCIVLVPSYVVKKPFRQINNWNPGATKTCRIQSQKSLAAEKKLQPAARASKV